MSACAVAARLPAPDVLERTSLAIAALDAVMSPDWGMRHFSFDPRWSPDERLASMRNGSGDSYNLVFGPAGSVVRGFDHESDLSPWGRPDGSVAPGLLEGFPAALRSAIDEPAFRTEGGPVTDLTFCAWRLAGDEAWSAGSADDVGGSAAWLFDVVLDGTPGGYQRFAAEYYEEEVPAEVVTAFYALQPADGALLASLRAEVDVPTVMAELDDMGYPVEGLEQLHD